MTTTYNDALDKDKDFQKPVEEGFSSKYNNNTISHVHYLFYKSLFLVPPISEKDNQVPRSQRTHGRRLGVVNLISFLALIDSDTNN
ncbi:MAG: hypothetical protein WAM26_03500 [Nitrososphaeraceae archaeon]